MARTHVEHVHAPELEWAPVSWSGWPEGPRVKVLSRDQGSGALSSLVTLPARYRRPAGHVSAGTELVVVSGSLRIGDASLPRLAYDYSPPGATQETWEAPEETELLFMTRTGPPDLAAGAGPVGSAGRIQLHPDDLEWVASRFPDGPVGTASAVYRIEDDGEMSLMVRFRPTTGRSGRFEFHSCVEECFLLEGHINIGNSLTEGGDMWAGTYFWRPPYVTHGNGYRTMDGLLYVYTDSPLVNSYTDGFQRTPEDNRRQLERETAAKG